MTVRMALAVGRGAQLLDETLPGWAERIDAGALDMRDMALCVLGQLGDGWAENTMSRFFGIDPHHWWRPDPLEDGWNDMYSLIGLPIGAAELREWALEHGFDLDAEDAAGEKTWESLTGLWREHIRARLQGKGGG